MPPALFFSLGTKQADVAGNVLSDGGAAVGAEAEAAYSQSRFLTVFAEVTVSS